MPDPCEWRCWKPGLRDKVLAYLAGAVVACMSDEARSLIHKGAARAIRERNTRPRLPAPDVAVPEPPPIEPDVEAALAEMERDPRD